MLPNILEDPHLELLQKVTNQLEDYLSIWCKAQGRNPRLAMKKECKMHSLHKGHQQEGRSTPAGTVGKMGTVCISVPT